MDDWQTRVDAVWSDAAALGDDALVSAIRVWAAERNLDEPLKGGTA